MSSKVNIERAIVELDAKRDFLCLLPPAREIYSTLEDYLRGEGWLGDFERLETDEEYRAAQIKRWNDYTESAMCFNRLRQIAADAVLTY